MIQPTTTNPSALTIAGSDSSAGAGIQADLKTFSALGVYGASVITSLTAQNTQGVQNIHFPPPAFVLSQMESVFTDLNISAVKIGMLGNAEMIGEVVKGLKNWALSPIVVDPVMVATSGDPLLDDDAVNCLVKELFPLASLITPNLHEAAKILSGPVASNSDQMRTQAKDLLELGAAAVLLKGGHGKGDEAVDIFVKGNQTEEFTSPRIHTRNTHGTGCTLSSAIAAFLAKGYELLPAIASAKKYTYEAIASADRLNIGKGSGPVHHFHQFWS